MDNQDNITEEGYVSADAVEEGQTESTVNDAVTPETAVEGTAQNQEVNSLTLEELNALTGKKFPTKESALKSIADTFKYVGKNKEQAKKEISTKDFVSREEFETILFYKDNPEIAKHREVIDAYAKANGISASEAAEVPSLKSLIESASGFEKVQQSKTVMSSSPRLRAVQDISKKAMEAANVGDTATRDALVYKMLNGEQ